MAPVEQSAQRSFLQNAFLNNRLSHAYLLSGLHQAKKMTCATEFSAWLLCENKKERNICGSCRGCILYQAGNHPDYMKIQPVEKARNIKIDQIRQLTAYLAQSAQRGGYRIIIISPMHALPLQAANALLKTLEEPTGKTIMLLLDDELNTLPATIISRCQKIPFLDNSDHLYQRVEALNLRDQLLQQLEAIAFGRSNPVQVARLFLKTPLEPCLQILLILLGDLVRVHLNISADKIVYQDVHKRLQALSAKISCAAVYQLIDIIFEKKSMLSRHIHLNQNLCLEAVFIAWLGALKL